MEIQKNDVVRGWFGEGVVTDVGFGFLEDQITKEPTGPEDDMVRIKQDDGSGYPKYRFVYKTDIKEIV